MSFVSFEEDIKKTIEKTDNMRIRDCASKHLKFTLPGYNIKSTGITRKDKYVWNQCDWENYQYWLKICTIKKQLHMRKLLIIAAWDQAKKNPPPPWILL